MIVKVLGYKPHPDDYHECVDEEGRWHKIDLLIAGEWPEGTSPEDLIGKKLQVERMRPYISIANKVYDLTVVSIQTTKEDE